MKLRLLIPLLVLIVAGACERNPTETPIRIYQEGEVYQFNVQSGEGKLCSEADRDVRSGRVVTITQRAIVVADVNNPPGGFTDDEYRALGHAFDTLVWPTLTANFGEPADIDRNQRIVLLFTRAVNELTPRGQTWYVGGFFAARDLFPIRGTQRLGACVGSNEAEMMYMLVPDPTGVVNGNARRKDNELRRTVAVLGHEFQHLINASRRLHGTNEVSADWNEEVWLNEGMSHIAEELLGYAASDLAPRQNLDGNRIGATEARVNAFSLYMGANIVNLAFYLERPDTASLMGADRLATRGATWQFLRYAADRRGGSEAGLWRGLVDSGSKGLANLRSTLGVEPMDWIHDWTVANYTDDAVAGVSARFQHPSWNFRALYPALRTAGGNQAYTRYPLRTHNLSQETELSLSIPAGSAAYVRFGVPPMGRAELRSGTGGASCQQNGPARDLVVGEVITVSGDQTTVICVNGGPTGGEFTYIPFWGGTGNRVVNVRGTGIIPVVGPPNPSIAPAGAMTLQGMPVGSAAFSGGGWEAELRERELRELSRLVPGGQYIPGGRAAMLSSASDPQLRVSIVRTR